MFVPHPYRRVKAWISSTGEPLERAATGVVGSAGELRHAEEPFSLFEVEAGARIRAWTSVERAARDAIEKIAGHACLAGPPVGNPTVRRWMQRRVPDSGKLGELHVRVRPREDRNLLWLPRRQQKMRVRQRPEPQLPHALNQRRQRRLAFGHDVLIPGREQRDGLDRPPFFRGTAARSSLKLAALNAFNKSDVRLQDLPRNVRNSGSRYDRAVVVDGDDAHCPARYLHEPPDRLQPGPEWRGSARTGPVTRRTLVRTTVARSMRSGSFRLHPAPRSR